MPITAKISLNLFLKKAGRGGSPIIFKSPERMDDVRGVAARNRTIIQIIPQDASCADALLTSSIILWLISGSNREVILLNSSNANAELDNHWLKKKNTNRTNGINANRVKNAIDAFSDTKLCLLHPMRISLRIK